VSRSRSASPRPARWSRKALYEARTTQRYVTVRGLAERVVPADTAIWPVVFTVTGDDLGQVQRQVESNYRADPRVPRGARFCGGRNEHDRAAHDDMQAQMPGQHGPAGQPLRGGGGADPAHPGVDEMRRGMQFSGELVQRGHRAGAKLGIPAAIPVHGARCDQADMIAEATRDARSAAQQFAADSGSRVGSIRNAQQGYFSISDRDPFSPEFKHGPGGHHGRVFPRRLTLGGPVSGGG
jgi:uncharacterized protein